MAKKRAPAKRRPRKAKPGTRGLLPAEARLESLSGEAREVAERVEKDELFLETDPLEGQVFTVGELTAGYRNDFWRQGHVTAGLGATATLSFVPDALHDTYGDMPGSVLVFLRAAFH